MSSTTKQAVDSVAGAVDTAVTGIKGIVDDIKKVFNNGFTFNFNTGFGLVPDSDAPADASAAEATTAPAPLGVPSLLMASKTSRNSKPSGTPGMKPSSEDALALPESTSLAAANATTKLLRLMADAGSEKDPDQSLSLLTAGEQLTNRAPLTPQGGVALLDLFK